MLWLAGSISKGLGLGGDARGQDEMMHAGRSSDREREKKNVRKREKKKLGELESAARGEW